MHSVPVLKELCKLFNCDENMLQERLNHPQCFELANKYLDGRRVKTAYKNRNGEYREFIFGRIALKSSLEQHAYQGYLNVNLLQHFYCKFRIRLLYPRMRVAIEYTKSGHNRYFPLELLELIHECEPEDCCICAIERPKSPKSPTSSAIAAASKANLQFHQQQEQCDCSPHEYFVNWCSCSLGSPKHF